MKRKPGIKVLSSSAKPKKPFVRNVKWRGEIIEVAFLAKAASMGHLTREIFSELVTGEAGLRDVDLVIRASGEKRLSDFLLWESAYAELHFTERMWPEFEAEDLAEALASFHRRERRFGGLQPEMPELAGEVALSV